MCARTLTYNQPQKTPGDLFLRAGNGYHRNDFAATCVCVFPLHQSSLSGTVDSADSTDARRMDMIYTIEDTPPWYLCIFLGLQVHKQ